MGKRKQKIILPPELPPEIPEEDIEVSDEDLQFVEKNLRYARFVERLDTETITRHVKRVADAKEDDVESLYEKQRLRKKLKQEENEKEEEARRAAAVDPLPVKTLDGRVYYRTVSDGKKEEVEEEEEDGGGAENAGVVRQTKVERRAKLKKSKKEEKKKAKESAKKEEEEQAPQAAVLAEVKEELTAEETFESKKRKLAELGLALMENPESNIKSLKEMFELCKDDNSQIVKLGLLSLLAVFKDIIPGYRIRLPTQKELEMKVSKDVKKMRFYESTLLTTYKAYLQKLIGLQKQSEFQHVTVRCISTLLEAVPHFNYHESLLSAVVQNMASPDDVIRKLCCASIKSLFTNEGKHGGEATVEAVQLIANLVKAHDCQLHPDTIEVFMSLSFNKDLVKSAQSEKDSKVKNKKNKKRKHAKESEQLQESDSKKSKRETMTKMRDEVVADYKAAGLASDVIEQQRMQTETLSAVFETYFRILRHTTMTTTSSASSSEGDGKLVGASSHPLLAPCLNGLAKFSHLIDLDYMGDLMNYLKMLAGGDVGSSSNSSSEKSARCLTVSERLQYCIVAFKVMRSNLDALNVDLQGFFVHLYNLILEFRPCRDQGEVLAEALKIMLCDDRQHDMQKAAAFVKRLATFSLCFGSAESLAALVTSKHLLQKNVKCRNLLENDEGGGSVAGTIAKYQPYASDPNLSGALASVLWELNLLAKHYHPAISTVASSIANMNTAHNQVFLATISPQKAFADLSLECESFQPNIGIKKANNKRKRGTAASTFAGSETTSLVSEDELRKKFSEHFMVLRDIKENKRLRGELNRTTAALQLYEEYRQQKKSTGKPKTKKAKKLSKAQ